MNFWQQTGNAKSMEVNVPTVKGLLYHFVFYQGIRCYGDTEIDESVARGQVFTSGKYVTIGIHGTRLWYQL